MALSVIQSVVPLSVLLLASALVAPAFAQVQLPGAVAPTASGTVNKPAGPPKPRRAGPPPPPKVPSDDGLLNRTLTHNGRSGTMQFAKDGKDLRLAKAVLAGEKISRPSETCTVDEPGMPLVLTTSGKPNGVTRYAAALPDCPVEFDVLEGAVLVPPRGKACEIARADCRVDPAGLWGQPANEIGAARTKEIEKSRAPAEQAMRSHFREWIEAATKGKDRDLVRKVSRDQAGFSSRRADTCAPYAREAEHGYCSLVLTQARSAALAARIQLPEEALPEEPKRRRR